MCYEIKLDTICRVIGKRQEKDRKAKKWKQSQNIDDWAGAIDRFHIPDDKMVEDIKEFVETI